jgi:hypothetical protein
VKWVSIFNGIGQARDRKMQNESGEVEGGISRKKELRRRIGVNMR